MLLINTINNKYKNTNNTNNNFFKKKTCIKQQLCDIQNFVLSLEASSAII